MKKEGSSGAFPSRTGGAPGMSGSTLLCLGFIATIIFAAFCIYLGVMDYCSIVEGDRVCISNYRKFLDSSPNEKGDTLAGLAGSLAFLWIIITVLLQGKELAAQREELELTRREFSKMAVAQEKQVQLLSAQAEIFEQEQKQRLEDRAKSEFDALLQVFVSSARDEKELSNSWRFEQPSDFPGNSRRVFSIAQKILDSDNSVDEKAKKAFLAVSAFEVYLIDLSPRRIRENSNNKVFYEDIYNLVIRMVHLEPSLSKDQKVRLEGLKAKEAAKALYLILKLDIWTGATQ